MDTIYYSSAFPRLSLALLVSGSFLLFLIVRIIYRLYFHHLARIPGPKIAAATMLYELYWDFIMGGQYFRRILEMHKTHGPIVRISPHEVHIADPDFLDTLYTGPSNPRDRWEVMANVFGVPTSFSGTVDYHLHKARRAPVNYMFSKKSVLNLEPVIVELVEKLSGRVTEWKGKTQPLSIRYAAAALTMDVITRYSFARSYGSLDAPDFAPEWPDAIQSIVRLTWVNIYLPWLPRAMKMLPLWVVRRLSAHMARIAEFHLSLVNQIKAIMQADKGTAPQSSPHPTIFHSLLYNSGLPESDRNPQHYLEEAQAIVGAGQVTTGTYIETTCWYLLTTPGVLPRLKSELESAMPDPNTLLPLRKLEELPYLSAVVCEGHRLAHSVCHRTQRVSRHTPIRYQDFSMPPGTPISMTAMFVHQDPTLFPDPSAFRPERWMGPDGQKLKKYLVPFGKGTMSCVGMHLAQAEIYLALTALFRRFEFEVFDTTQDDVEMVADYFLPVTRKGSKGLRVLVK